MVRVINVVHINKFRQTNKFVDANVQNTTIAIGCKIFGIKTFTLVGDVEDIRKSLWQLVKSDQIPNSLIKLHHNLKIGNPVTIVIGKESDIPIANLLIRFLDWYRRN
jgi:hypothetical protein